MFDHPLPESSAVAGLGDAALVDAMAVGAAVEAAAAGRRLAVIAEFAVRRLGGDERADWAADGWDAASVEVAAALGISLGRASNQMDLGLALRTRLPKVAALLCDGVISLQIARTAVTRTSLIVDRDALEVVDSRIATAAAQWGRLSQAKLEAAVDLWVNAVDPAAVHRTRDRARERDIRIGDPDNDSDGLTAIWGMLLKVDGEILDARLAAMAAMVCGQDPRTVAQRRSDALGALGAGHLHLSCACGREECTAVVDDGRATSVTIHVLADAEAVSAPVDPQIHGEKPPAEPIGFAEAIHEYHEKHCSAETLAPSAATAEAATPEPVESPKPSDPGRPRRRNSAGYIPGGPVIPAEQLADLIARGATIDHLKPPAAESQKGHRPTPSLATWIRHRDLTCRAPGCDRPATSADLDHTNPWPYGPTHPSNIKGYCRKHHLVKTFWPGFTDRQKPDGTIEFTTPTGHTYTTRPLSVLLFPRADASTATLPEPSGPPPPQADGQMMPKRATTRTQQRTYRINAQRKRNLLEHPPQPPPF